MIKKLLFSFVVGLVIGGALLYWQFRTRDHIRTQQTIDKFVLYSIDGTDRKTDVRYDNYFHDYPVLGSVELVGDERNKLINAMNSGIGDGFGAANCFWPRHAVQIVRGGEVKDYVICFQCLQIYVFDEHGNKEVVLTSDRPRASFNKVLAAHGIPMAPDPFAN